MRHRSIWRVILPAAIFMCLAQQANSCSWAVGYFHQITRLRGTVVGTNSLWLAHPRWLRQRFVRANVTLRVYGYRNPSDIHNVQPLETTRTDSNGKFDFGVLAKGHYTLVIDWPTEYGNMFDVEITRLPAATSSVEIDVSPVNPACKGGHEFITYSR